MKTIPLLLFIGLSLQAKEFENLNFDAGNPANVHPQPGGSFLLGPATELLPGWRVEYDGVVVDEVLYWPQGGIGFCCGLALSEVRDSFRPVFGLYGISVDPARPGPGGAPVGMPVTISQTGLVPEEAQFLSFSRPFYEPEIRVNGQITVWDRQASSLDVRGYAGQEIDLAITFKAHQSESFEIFGFTPVPEPETWALLGVGLAVAGLTHQIFGEAVRSLRR